MADPSLAALAPLGKASPVTERVGGLTITENPDLALASVAMRRGRGADFTARATQLLGFDLPGPGRAAGAAPWHAFWTGPDQWFIEAPFATHEDIAARLKTGLGDAASITEQTDGWARFDVSAPEGGPASGLLDMFERLSAIDIRAMLAGMATRSQIEHMGCLVLCRAAGTRFSVLVMRSAAGSLHHALMLAARSVA